MKRKTFTPFIIEQIWPPSIIATHSVPDAVFKARLKQILGRNVTLDVTSNRSGKISVSVKRKRLRPSVPHERVLLSPPNPWFDGDALNTVVANQSPCVFNLPSLLTKNK